ncbi:hypothetical protein [Limnobacter sp.]|uniref:hypothetical protein n=1 Tax=Limnobacter sp. TaxID=2003368 RepID=UPI003516A889
MGHTFIRTLLGCALGATLSTAWAQPPALLMTYSFDSLTGKFGQSRETEAKSFTLGATLVGETYRASLFVPYISLKGPGTVVNGTVTPAGGAPTRKAKGLGDMVATYTRDVVGDLQSKGFAASVTGLAKLATGDERDGLGTGKTDYGIQADLAYRFQNNFALTGVFGRTLYGDTPTLRLLHGNYSILGFGFPFGDDLYINFTTSERDKLLANTEKRRERAMSAVYSLSQTSALQFGYTRGRSTASPDDVFSFSLVTQVE